MDPNTATNLVDQMRAVSQQFLGFAPAGSYYFYNNAVWIVTGKIDAVTGQLVLQSVNGGGTTLMSSIAALYPSAVAAPAAAAPIAAAAGGTSALSTLASLAPVGMSAPGLVSALKNKPPAGQWAAGDMEHVTGSGPGGGSGFSNMNLSTAQTGFNQAQQNVDSLTSKLAQVNGELDPNSLLNQKITGLQQDLMNTYPGAFNSTNTLQENLARLYSESGTNSIARAKIEQLDSLTKYQIGLPDAANQIQGQLSSAQTALSQAQNQLSYSTFMDGITNQAPTQFASLGDKQAPFLYTASQELKSQGITPANTPNFADKQFAQAQTDYTNSISQFTPQDLAAAKQAVAVQMNQSVGENLYSANDVSNTDPKVFAALEQNKQTAVLQHAQKAYNSALRSQGIQFGVEAAAAAGTAYAEESAISSMFANGFSGKEFVTALGTAGGLFISLHLMNGLLTETSPLMHWFNNLPNIFGLNVGGFLGSALHFMTTLKGFAILQGLFILLGLLFGKKPPAEQTAAETLNAEVNPVVWNPSGQVIFLTAGLTMASMGINLGPSAPMMQTMTMSQAQVTQALQGLGASSVPMDNTRYADVFVQQGAAGQPTRVIYLTSAGTDSRENVIETVHEQTLNNSFQFATSQPPTGYVPFFVPGSNGKVTANPAVVQSLTAQQHLLQCADGTWVKTASQCANAAAVTSHSSGN